MVRIVEYNSVSFHRFITGEQIELLSPQFIRQLSAAITILKIIDGINLLLVLNISPRVNDSVI